MHDRLAGRDPVARLLHDFNDFALERRLNLPQVELDSGGFELGILGVGGQTGDVLFVDGLLFLGVRLFEIELVLTDLALADGRCIYFWISRFI